MEHNKERNTGQGTEDPVPAERRKSRQAGYSQWSTSDSPISSAECQTGK